MNEQKKKIKSIEKGTSCTDNNNRGRKTMKYLPTSNPKEQKDRGRKIMKGSC